MPSLASNFKSHMCQTEIKKSIRSFVNPRSIAWIVLAELWYAGKSVTGLIVLFLLAH